MLRRRFSWLLALLLVLQSGLAAAHCLRLAGASGATAGALTICTPAGLRSVVLPAPHGLPGDAADDRPAIPAADGFCPACHALPTVAPPEPPALPAPAWAAALPAHHPFAAAEPRPRARDPARGPRGPPVPV